MNYIGFYDGSANPNPGKLGLGITIFKDKREIMCAAKPAGHGTNNEAEYLALIFLLEMAVELGIKAIVVYGDSQLITNQVNGVWGVGKETLKQHHHSVTALKSKFDSIEFVWCKREKNKRADKLSKRGGELTELKYWMSDSNDKKVTNNISVIEDTSLPENTISPLNTQPVKVKVVCINPHNYLVTDSCGISKLSVYPTLRCTCKEFYSVGACIHSESLRVVKTDLLRHNHSIVM
jgi:ribonuclease HI